MAFILMSLYFYFLTLHANLILKGALGLYFIIDSFTRPIFVSLFHSDGLVGIQLVRGHATAHLPGFPMIVAKYAVRLLSFACGRIGEEV